MTAKYWTKTGEDMWVMTERTVFDFRNSETGDVETLHHMPAIKDAGFLPVKVIMPTVKQNKTPKVKKKTAKKAEKSLRRGPKSKYKGVKAQGKKFMAQCWDKKNKKLKYLGMFESELIAAATVQEAKGNSREARRLRNEHEEGDMASVQERPSEE